MRCLFRVEIGDRGRIKCSALLQIDFLLLKCDFEIYESTVILTRNVERVWHKPRRSVERKDLKAPSKVSKQSHKSFEDAERKGKCSRQCEEMKEKNWFHSSRFVSIFICDMERIFEFISMLCLRNRVVIPMYVNECKHCRYLPDICWIFANISSSGQSFLIFHFHSYFCFCCCCCKQRSTR